MTDEYSRKNRYIFIQLLTTELAVIKNSAVKLYYNRNPQYGSRMTMNQTELTTE